MSKQIKGLIIVWVVAGLVAVGSFLWINHEVNAMVKKVGVVDYSPTTLKVVDYAPSNIEGFNQGDGGELDIQPATNQNVLTMPVRLSGVQSGGLVWLR